MPVYNYADVCNHLSTLLDEVKQNKEVIIKDNRGEMFVLLALPQKGTSYNLPDLDLGLNRDEIVSYIKEVRER